MELVRVRNGLDHIGGNGRRVNVGSEGAVMRLKDDVVRSATCDFMTRSESGVTGMSLLRSGPWGECSGIDMDFVMCNVRLLVTINGVSHVGSVTIHCMALRCDTR